MTSGNGSGGAKVRDAATDRERLRAIHARLAAGDIATAGKLAEDALRDGIDHVMVLSLVAGRHEEAGRHGESLALLMRAKAAAPDAAGIRNALGLCLAALGRTEEALSEYAAALAADPGFAPALANRGNALVALARRPEARRDYEAALAIDPANLVAINGLAVLALDRHDLAEARRLALQVAAREPGYPGAMLTLAGADLADAKPGLAEARLRLLLADPRLAAADAADARLMLGEALDGLGRFEEAFAAFEEGNGLLQRLHPAGFARQPRILGLVRQFEAALAARRFAAAFAQGQSGPAQRHVFLLGFPRSGGGALGDQLAARPDIALLADAECLIEGARAYLSDGAGFARLLAAEEAELAPHRAAYWRAVADAGAAPAGRLFVDQQPFHLFKLPLIARLFPEARIVLVQRDPRDVVLDGFRHRFAMGDFALQMLSLAGAADLYAAAMALVAASERAFGLFTHVWRADAADQTGELAALYDYLGLPAPDTVVPAPARDAIWRNYRGPLARVLPVLQPWIDRFGY